MTLLIKNGGCAFLIKLNLFLDLKLLKPLKTYSFLVIDNTFA